MHFVSCSSKSIKQGVRLKPPVRTPFLLLLGGLACASAPAQDEIEHTPLALDQAILMALEHNLDVAIQRESIRSAEGGVLESQGTFDPTVSSGYSTGEDQRALNAESSIAAGGLTSVRTEAESADLSVAGQLPFSLRYSLDAQDRSSADTFNEFEEEHVSSLSATLTQPLLRGRGGDYATYGVRVARRNLHTSKLDFSIRVEQILLDVERAYWDLIRADRILAVRQKGVDAADSLLKQVEIRIDVQTASEADRVQAQSGLAQRELALLEARRERTQQDRVLKNLILKDLAEVSPPFEPTDALDSDRVVETRERTLEIAMERRPEIARAQIGLQDAEDALDQARKERRPQVDLEASYGLNGLGDSFGDSMDSIEAAEDDMWRVGLVYRKAWPDRQNRGAMLQHEAASRIQTFEVEQAQRRIIVEINDLFDRLGSVQDQIQAGQVAVSLARLNRENEQAKFDVQKSTVHEILQFDAELQEAELNLEQSRVEHQKILAELERAKGALAERWGIELE